MIALLVMAAATQTAVDAERSFAAMAQTDGQWTAFRAYAAPDALMFTPEPVKAHELIAGWTDPVSPIMWWPARSWVSGDGLLAVNTGPSVRNGGRKHGTFTTVWQKQADGRWKWLSDSGRDVPAAVAAHEEVEPSRPGMGTPAAFDAAKASIAKDVSVQWERQAPMTGMEFLPKVGAGETIAAGGSPDGTLHWRYAKYPGIEDEAFGLSVWQWDGKAHRLVLQEIGGLAE